MREHVYSAAAHNIVDSADRPVSRRDIQPYGSCLWPVRWTREEFVLGGEVVRPGRFKHKRTLRYQPGRRLRVEDRIVGSQDETFVGRLHFSHECEIEAAEKGVFVKRDGELLLRIVPPDGCEVRVSRGQREPFRGWETVAYGKMVPAPLIEAYVGGKDSEMVWELVFEA
jgi:hypothetical protein